MSDTTTIHIAGEERTSEPAGQPAGARRHAQAPPRLRTIIDSTEDSICAVGTTYRFLLFNTAYARSFLDRFAYEPRTGMNVLDVFRDDTAEQEQVRQWWSRALAGEAYSLLREVPDESGGKRYFDVRFSPILDGEGRQTGAISVTRDVTEILETREALDASNAQLREADRTLAARNRELQDFAYIASHDLREPLRKIRVFADLVIDDEGARMSDEGRHLLSRMQHASARMMRLLDDLLAFSRVETQGAAFEEVDLTAVAHEAVEGLGEQIREEEARVDIGTLPVVTADPGQMHQLFHHLGENTLKFRRRGTPLNVYIGGETVENDRGLAARLCVEDNGIGFEEQYLDRIFDPFERLHGRGVHDGTGMGLAICRRIVERHGGRISAKSAPGAGTTIEITIPANERG